MKLYLPLKHSPEFEKWIQVAADKKVEELDISFSKKYNGLGWEIWKLHSFPYRAFADQAAVGGPSLRRLSSSSCKLSLPPKFGGFSFLTSLVLKDTPSCLKFTSGSLSYSLKLKHLNISTCGLLEEIDIFITLQKVLCHLSRREISLLNFSAQKVH